jgi:aspartate/methionine/tyrosine aminotransferase
MNNVFANLPVSVFEVMSRLAREQNAVNLGQGFPDDPGPQDVREKAADAVVNGWNQYPPMLGLPELRQAVSAHYRHWQDLAFDPDSEIMITSGATEAIAGALMALIQPGDEVVMFQPMYDAYLPLVQRAGGVPRFVRLEPPHWRFDEEKLARAFTPKTRVVLFNNPLNPAATVFPRDNLELLARYCEKFDAIAV